MRQPESDMRSWSAQQTRWASRSPCTRHGDRANAIILAIYDSVARAHGRRDRRFRVEHAQHLRAGRCARFGRCTS